MLKKIGNFMKILFKLKDIQPTERGGVVSSVLYGKLLNYKK
ncbi:hypothetical protein DB41_KR00090 [Neochlamydia sp. TUME1]|nr:hypothetical protein DB41_KR00090 [Neochlamydia sp. TUME1]